MHFERMEKNSFTGNEMNSSFILIEIIAIIKLMLSPLSNSNFINKYLLEQKHTICPSGGIYNFGTLKGYSQQDVKKNTRVIVPTLVSVFVVFCTMHSIMFLCIPIVL